MTASGRKSSRPIVWAVALLLMIGLARFFGGDASAGKDLVGERAPEFSLQDTAGQTVDLDSLEGKVVVMDFWAVWCGPCQQSMPFFQTLEDKYGKEGLVVIGVHVDDRMPPPDRVQEYLDERNVRYRNLISTVKVDNAFEIFAMPTTYLIDRKGVVSKRHVGFNPKTTPEELEHDVREMLGLD